MAIGKTSHPPTCPQAFTPFAQEDGGIGATVHRQQTTISDGRGLLETANAAAPQGFSTDGVLPLALLFARPLKEKRLMRRREKLPDFFLGAEVLLALGKSSCDWLRPASFCLFFLRKISLVPLRRKPTAGGGGD